jgi:hypothetical protein
MLGTETPKNIGKKLNNIVKYCKTLENVVKY